MRPEAAYGVGLGRGAVLGDQPGHRVQLLQEVIIGVDVIDDRAVVDLLPAALDEDSPLVDAVGAVATGRRRPSGSMSDSICFSRN